MKRIIAFCKRETVLVAAAVLALISMIFVHPSSEYKEYIDWRVLGILLTLMYIMQGLSVNEFFDRVGAKLLSKTRKTWQLLFVLVFLCFFFSMFITNDVALITFVPFAIMMLQKSNNERLTILLVVLQTLAANLGSMLTPIGNPQNLYLYNLAGLGIGAFLKIMFPYSLVSGILLACSILFIKGKGKDIDYEKEELPKLRGNQRRKMIIYLMLFLFALLVVARVFPWEYVLLATVLLVISLDKKVVVQVDYCLLLTFIAFFIFTGNLSHMDSISQWLERVVNGNEVWTGALLSQIISNVPATLMLSGFTDNYNELLVGVNLGGLGTLIASMASLISYKLYAAQEPEKKGKYLAVFTGMNAVYFFVLAGCFLISKPI